MAAHIAFENFRIYRLAEEIADLVEGSSIEKKQQTTNNNQLTLPQF